MYNFYQNLAGISSSKLEELQKQLKDKESRENKFKQLALKAKKDASDTKTKVLEQIYENVFTEIWVFLLEINKFCFVYCSVGIYLIILHVINSQRLLWRILVAYYTLAVFQMWQYSEELIRQLPTLEYLRTGILILFDDKILANFLN